MFLDVELRLWISWMENYFDRKGHTDFEKLHMAHGFIWGEAERYIDSLKPINSWKEMKETLLLRFGEDDDPEKIKLENEDRRSREQLIERLEKTKSEILQETSTNLEEVTLSSESLIRDESSCSSEAVPGNEKVRKTTSPTIKDVLYDCLAEDQEAECSAVLHLTTISVFQPLCTENSCALDRGAASQTCVCEINHELQKIESSVTEETEEKPVKQSAEMPHLWTTIWRPASVDDSFKHSDGISYEMQTDYLTTEGAKTSLNVSLQSHRVQQTFAQRHMSRRLLCKKKKGKYPKAWKYKFKSRKFQRLMLRRLVNFKPYSDSEFLVDVTCKKKQWRSLTAWKFMFRTKNLQRFKITRVKHLAPVSDYTVSVLDMRMLGTNQRHLHELLELREVNWQRFKRSQLNCSFDCVGEQKLVRWWQVVSEFCWLGISCGTTTSVKRTQYNITSVQPQFFTKLVSGEARYLLLYGFMNVRADTEDVKICQGLLSLLQLHRGHEVGRVTHKLQQRKFYKSWKFKYK